MGSDRNDGTHDNNVSKSEAPSTKTEVVSNCEAALLGNRAFAAIVDREGRCLWMSDDWVEVIPGQTPVSKLQDLLSSNSDEIGWCDEAISRAVLQGEVSRREIKIGPVDGGKKILVSLGPGLGDRTAASRAVCLAIDITESHCSAGTVPTQTERQARILALVAHELRNPLSTIRSGLKIFELASDEAHVTRAREMMERQLSHSIRLVNDVLDLARLSEGRMSLDTTHVAIGDVINVAMELSSNGLKQGKHSLTLSLPEEPIELTIDARRMAQVISNLLDNAAKYTPDGGKIHLSVAHDSGSVVVRVADNGRGIPPEKRDEIFKAFSQVEDHQSYRRGGLGIGLFLVKSIVEAHGGKVSAQSDGDGLGSVFTVHLPIDRR